MRHNVCPSTQMIFSIVMTVCTCRQYIHPAKAGVHAHAYGSAHQHLSTHVNRHDAASAIMHAALRTIVDRLATSPSPRTAVLHSLHQLDRLPPGSKDDSRKFSLIPRRRGDIHPDLTAAVLRFTLHKATSSNSRCKRARSCSNLNSSLSGHLLSNSVVELGCSLGRLFRSRSKPDLHTSTSQQRQCSTGGLKSILSRSTHASTCSVSTAHTSTLASPDASSPTATERPNSTAQPQFPAAQSQGTRVMFDDTVLVGEASLDATTGTTSSELNSVQQEGSSQARCSTEGERRWQLLQTHVSTLYQERSLRRQLWGSAVSLARSQHTFEGSSDKLVESQSRDDVVAAAASQACSEQGNNTIRSSSSRSNGKSSTCSLKWEPASRKDSALSASSWDFGDGSKHTASSSKCDMH
jgi:hypothetical protein